MLARKPINKNQDSNCRQDNCIKDSHKGEVFVAEKDYSVENQDYDSKNRKQNLSLLSPSRHWLLFPPLKELVAVIRDILHR